MNYVTMEIVNQGHAPLETEIYHEQAVLDLLGIERKHLDALRNKKHLPCIWLNARRRIYLASDLLEWLQELRYEERPVRVVKSRRRGDE